jgi:primary-amine oxidase
MLSLGMCYTLKCCLALTVSRDAYNSVIAFKESTWTVETFEKLPKGTQPQISVQELLRCEEIVKNDATVQKLAKDVGQYM